MTELRAEMVQPMQGGALDPVSRYEPVDICRDCGAAEGLIALTSRQGSSMGPITARIVIGNERCEQNRLSLQGAGTGLLQCGYRDEWIDASRWVEATEAEQVRNRRAELYG